MSPQLPPPTTEVYTARQLVERHPHLLNAHRMAWAMRHRRKNGLAPAVFESKCGELLIHEPAFLAWFLGLTNRAKPRRLRTTDVVTE
jgi:hypothetical protein